METLKFGLFSIVTLALVGLLSYWAVNTIQNGTESNVSQKLAQFTEENKQLKAEAERLRSDVARLEAESENSKAEEQPQPAPEKPNIAPEEPETTYKYQALISELERMVKDNIYLKLKSSGTRVGTVQKFLNAYNKTSNKVDNDYGASTKTAVTAFQKAQKITADGEAGVGTFKKMIEWLKRQG